MRRRILAAMGAAAVALVAAGCGNSSGATTADGKPIPAAEIHPVDRAQLRTGGTMHWPLDEFPRQLNLYQVDGARAAAQTVVGSMMPQLWRYDAKAVPSANPAYLSDASVTSTKPKQVVTYTLNPKAKWSDGTPLSWKDFQAQWQALGGKDQRFEVAASQGYNLIQKVAKGKAANQVVVTFAKPFGDWQSLFDPLYPASTTTDPTTFDKGWVNKVPVTAGPFKFGSVDQKAQTLTVVRDPAYWGNKAKLDSIVFEAMNPSQQLAAFAKGSIDFVTVNTNAAAYAKAKAVPNSTVRKAAAPDYSVITFNGTAPNLKSPDVRRAIALSIDRTAIAKAALAGVDWPAVPLDNHFFVNTQDGYKADGGGEAHANVKQAGKLLDAQGWKLQGGKRMKDGKQLELSFLVPTDSPRSEQIGEMVKGMLGKVGVKLDLKSVPIAHFFDKYVTPGKFDLAPSAWQGTPYPVSSSRSLFVEPTTDPNGDLLIQQNFARIGSPTIDRTMDQAISEIDPAKAREKANQADAMIWQEVHSLPLYQQPQIRVCDKKLANFGANGFQSVHYEDIGFTK